MRAGPPPFADVERLLQDAQRRRAFPAAAIEVGRRDGVLWQWACGQLTYDDDAPAATVATVFDLASLTKVLATTPLVVRLVAARRLLLNDPVAAHLEDWRGADRERVTVADLLEHTGGLIAWWDLYRRGASRREYAHEIGTMPLAYVPRSQSIYSDLGFILLGLIVERAGGRTLDAQFADSIGNASLLFTPGADMRSRTAPTEIDSAWRKRLLVGEVHDENASVLGGVAGHAGLFGTVEAVGQHARLVMETFDRETALGNPRLMARVVTPSRVPRSSRALGWDTMRPTSSCGHRLSHAAIGHTGFTGTSLWIDPMKDLYVVLLTNRVHPARPEGHEDQLTRLRPQVHDAIVAAMEA